MPVSQLIWTILVPLLLGALSAIPAQSAAGKSTVRGDCVKRLSAILGVGLGYLVGHVAILGWPGWPITTTGPRTFVLAVLAIIIGILESTGVARTWGRLILRLVLAAMGAWLMMTAGFRDRNTWLGETALIVGPAMLTTLVWTSTDALSRRTSRGSIPIALGILCALTALVFFKNESASFAQQVASLGVAIGGLGLAAVFVPGITVSRGALAVLVPLYHAFILGAWYYGLPPAVAVLLAIAPLTLWIGSLRPPAVAFTARVCILTSIALLALVILLWLKLDAASTDSFY